MPLCVVGVWVRETMLSCRARALQWLWGVKRVLEKRRAGCYSGLCVLFLETVCGKTLWGTQTAIPSPTDIIIHQPHRGNADGRGGGGGLKQTEQRNFSDWGGIKMEEGVVRETWAHSHWPNNTNETAISQTQTMVPIPAARTEEGQTLTSARQLL